MSEKTIPQLPALAAPDFADLVIVDNGTQTFKATLEDTLALSASGKKFTEVSVQKGASFVVPSDVTKILLTLVPWADEYESFIPANEVPIGIDASERVKGWGANTDQSIGAGAELAAATAVSNPWLIDFNIMPPKVRQIGKFLASGSWAIAEDNLLYRWGSNDTGWLGLNNSTLQNAPTTWKARTIPIRRLLSPYTRHNMFAEDTLGRTWNMGGTQGPFSGTNLGGAISQPTLIQGSQSWREIIAGGNRGQADSFTFGISTAGELYSWGFNARGQLGTGDNINRSTPTLVTTVAPGTTFQKIRFARGNPDGIGGSNTRYVVFGLTSQGSLYSWGAQDGVSSSGLLGVNSTAVSTPTLVFGSGTFVEIACSNIAATALALRDDGALFGWGRNRDGTVGDGTTVNRSTPVLITGPVFEKIYVIDGGTDDANQEAPCSSFGITASGELYAWGHNAFGQLGVGDVFSRSTPTLVLGGILFEKLYDVVTYGNVFGLSKDGRLFAWGRNANGSLALGDSSSRSSPVLVANFSPYRTSRAVTKTLQVTPGQTIEFESEQGFLKADGEVLDVDVYKEVKISYETWNP